MKLIMMLLLLINLIFLNHIYNRIGLFEKITIEALTCLQDNYCTIE